MQAIRLLLSDQILEDVKIECERHIVADKLFHNQPTMLKMLIREALIFRRKFPDAMNEINSIRNEYNKELYDRGDLTVFTPDKIESTPLKTRRRWTKRVIDGVPVSYSELIECIKELGNYAHTKEIGIKLNMKEGTVTSRLVRALEKRLVQRLDWGVYTCVVVDPFEPRRMTAKETAALDRARLWVKKSRGIEL